MTSTEEVSFVGVSPYSLLEAFNGTNFGSSMIQASYHVVNRNNVQLNTSQCIHNNAWTQFYPYFAISASRSIDEIR